ncbi:hypothetical protein J3P71_35095 (plasmid) [Rhizobium leguminosarum]|uniref:alpha/beta hydrolase n=1 Tax=Rhizobium leguminosarum TaxID=384 RepID=UPI001441038A|nr:alpha/beta hydrolase [Rhizobium leguminosarum]MBY5838996.1 alpha/beta hydrolase [Rhizobium leguminosarum]NKM78049.1 hypothetical protein [Rhizobium leguminosarum bv. viciae]QSZ12900.1 hypothetical protein J3P71_35095 [Rhizobium leguminosarum]
MKMRRWRWPPWLAEALKTHRVILIDQRGTGRSSREHDGVRQSAVALRRLMTLVREQGAPLAS